MVHRLVLAAHVRVKVNLDRAVVTFDDQRALNHLARIHGDLDFDSLCGEVHFHATHTFERGSERLCNRCRFSGHGASYHSVQ